MRGSGFLADELNWPSRERVPPALGFGFAVDGGSGFIENSSPILGSIPRKGHCGQAFAAIEGPRLDAGDAVWDRDARQAFALTEGGMPDAGNAVRDRDARQVGECEGIISDAGDAGGDRDARQAAAFIEGSIPDAGDAIRNRDARQVGAVPEGTLPDTGDAVRDVVIVPCLASRISMQHRLLCIEQNPIDLRVIHVPRANLNCRQAAAAIEGPCPDAGNAVTNRDARQVAAFIEGQTPDAGDSLTFDSRRNG